MEFLMLMIILMIGYILVHGEDNVNLENNHLLILYQQQSNLLLLKFKLKLIIKDLKIPMQLED